MDIIRKLTMQIKALAVSVREEDVRSGAAFEVLRGSSVTPVTSVPGIYV